METIKRNRTTKAIYHSLFTLLETKPFDLISVNDICQESLISRTTFYAYFEDKFSLVEFCFEEERASMGLVRGVDVEKNLLTFLIRIKEKHNIYKHLLVSHASSELSVMITSHFEETVDYVLDDVYTDEERYIVSQFYAGGISYTIMQWILAGCDMDEKLLANTIWKIMNRN